MKLVSVIMPAYKEETHLAESVRSVLEQSYTNWELLIVDDCSPDETFAVARGLAASDDRIRAFQLPENSGRPAVPRIFAIERSRGDYIAFLDGDDIWFKDKLERQLGLFDDENVVAVCSPAETIIDDARTGQVSTSDEVDLNSTIQENTIVNSSVIVRKFAYLACGGLDPSPVIRFGEDWDLWLRLLSAGKMERTKAALVGYRIHSGNQGRSEDQYAMVTRIIDKNSTLPGLSSAALARSRAKFEYKYGVSMTGDDPARARRHLRAALAGGGLPPRLAVRAVLMFAIACLPFKGARRAAVAYGPLRQHIRRRLKG